MTKNQTIRAKDKVFGVSGEAIQASWPGQCFGCSRSNRHSLQPRFFPTENGCLARCEIPDHYCGFDGIAHGGITTTLLDEVAAWAMAVQLGRPGLTLELTVRYQAPVPTERELIVEGTLLAHDEKTALIRSTVCSVEGASLAEAESRWRLSTVTQCSKMMGVPEPALERFFEALQAEV